MREALLRSLVACSLLGIVPAHAQGTGGAGSKSASVTARSAAKPAGREAVPMSAAQKPAAPKPATQPANPASGAQASPSSHELLKAAIAVFRDSVDRKASPPMLVAGNTLYIDRDDLDERLRTLGFAVDYPSGGPVYSGRTFTVRSWNAVKSCRGTGAVENCTMPARTAVVRFFNVRWTVENTELMLVMGAFRRADTDANNQSLGGSVATLVFKRRGNQWVLNKVAKVVNS